MTAPSVISRWQAIDLWKRVLIALGLGVIAGLAAHHGGADEFVTLWIKPFGDGFIRLIRMLIVPLIVTTLVCGIMAIGDPKRLGSLGGRAMALYLGTTFFAVFIGLGFASLIGPGVGIDLTGVDQTTRNMLKDRISADAPSLTEKLLALIPTNPFGAMAEGDILALIVFSILIGLAILWSGEPGKPVARFFTSAEAVIMRLTLFVMELAPFGVFALICWVMADLGLGILTHLGKLALALYLACFVQIIAIYGGLLIKFILGLPIGRFFTGILDAQGVAFSTASSSATLPVTMTCAQKNLGIDDSVAGSVLPLGATINMDGTAIYLGIIAIFAAQAFGIELAVGDYLLIALTATLTSIGVAGIPSASLFLAFTVLSVIGVELDQYTLIIAFMLPFDRLLDMMRTVTNVSGDLAIACCVAKWEGELEEDIFQAASRL